MLSQLGVQKLRSRQASILINRSGMAMIETLPILVIFLVLITFGLGFFGFVHTGILNSIGARTYAFETFSNRADLRIFRDYYGDRSLHFVNFGNRFHAITSELNAAGRLGEAQFATTRPLAFGRNLAQSAADSKEHNLDIYNIVGRNRKGGVEASPAWIMIGYGICIDANCGDDN